MKNIYKTRIRLLTDILIRNATYLGLSESTTQHMLKAAFESNPGTKISVDESAPDKVRGKCKYYKQMPHHPLPNCVEYGNRTSEFDLIGALFGRMIRQDKGQRTIKNGRNIRANRHVNIQMNELGLYRDRGQNRYYWRHALYLMTQPAFQLMAFNYVCSNWHRDMSTKEANKILKAVKELVQEMKVEINLRRVYIEKANGKWRPLGVPTKAWRVYLHMWNVLVVWFRMGRDGQQHAYVPGKGVHTAWISLLDHIDDENIYEFDLKSFFPSVSLEANYKIMIEELGFPVAIAETLKSMNQSITKLEEKDLLTEDNDRKVLLNTSGQPNPNLPREIQRKIKGLLNDMSSDRRKRFIGSEYIKDILPKGWTVFKEVGVPQGAATSCGISTINLHYMWKRLGDTLLMYADDGLVFPRSSQDQRIEDEERGVCQNDSKSSWVKRNGVWQKPLKFLGLELIPPTDKEVAKLRAKTRKGSTKEFELNQMLLVHLMNERDLMLWLSECESSDKELNSLEEVEDEREIFVKEERPNVLVKELIYSKRGKTTKNANTLTTKSSTETLKSVEEDMKMEVSLSEWLRRASERLSEIRNPLKLLFEGKGLSFLTELYSTDNTTTPIAFDQTLTCKPGSWAYRNLGACLYNKLENFRPTEELTAKINAGKLKGDSRLMKMQSLGYSNWEIVSTTRRLRRIWASNFHVKGWKTPNWEGVWEEVYWEMRSYLKSFTLDIYNLSTYATNDLLESNLELITPSRILFSKANRVKTQSQTKEELLERAKKSRKRAEREFKRKYGRWPKDLERPK